MKKYPNDINIIANPDNFFDDKFLNDIYELYSKYKNKEKLCLGLTRWNYFNEDDIRYFNAKDSQDVFIFYGSVDLRNNEQIPLGRPGCDNRFAYESKSSGYILKNPSISLKIIHYHLSQIRTCPHEEWENFRIKGSYYFIEPEKINLI
jgi:hypothetical protein